MARKAAPSVWTVIMSAAITSVLVTRPNEVLQTLATLISKTQSANSPQHTQASAPAPLLIEPKGDAPIDSHLALAAFQKKDATEPAETKKDEPEVDHSTVPFGTPAIKFVTATGLVDLDTGGAVNDLTSRATTHAGVVDLQITPTDPVRGNLELIDASGQRVNFFTGGDSTQVNPTMEINGTSPVTLHIPLPLDDVTEAGFEYTARLVNKPNPVAGTDVIRPDSPLSRTLALKLDRVGPRIESVIYDDTTREGRGATIIVRFQDNDLSGVGTSGAIDGTSLVLRRRPTDVTISEAITNFAVKSDAARPDRIFLDFENPLPAGDYVLSLTEEVAKGNLLKDKADNEAGTVTNADGNIVAVEPQVLNFTVLPPSETGPQVEFPQFTPPKVEGDREQPFNPDDFVITRVARLYYMRDAHRVAQIINRNVRSYNKAAVTQSERAAEDARELANKLVDDRRAAERAAVRAAEDLRRNEAQLAEAEADVELSVERDRSIQEIDNQITDIKEKQIPPLEQELTTAPLPPPERQDQLKDQINNLKQQVEDLTREKQQLEFGKSTQLRDLAAMKQDVETARNSVTSQRQTMVLKQEQLDEAQAKEDRQVEEAFRKEVAAANADPDTYAPGKIDSVDPVTQVSISVIGEGLIQLRGPTKGVNKIRTMINQIDSPLGQVKVGIFTVQINGERGDRMERVARRIEGYVDLSRFLTSHSLMLMRRSVVEVASEIATRAYAEFDGHTQIDRDRRYLYAFFGRDFVDSLFAMNSEFLFTGNRLLSLNSMDNISLNRALFILALAKNDVRRCILERFMEHVTCDLPQAEYDYRIATRIDNPGKHLMKKVHEEVMNRYIFRNFRSVFETEIVGNDTINPMQLEFLRLAQIFKSQMVAEVELKQRIVERGLIQDRANDETAEFAILDEVQRVLRQQLKLQLVKFAELGDKISIAIESVNALLAKGSQIGRLRDNLSELQALRSQALEVLRQPNNDAARLASILRTIASKRDALGPQIQDSLTIVERARGAFSPTDPADADALTALNRLTTQGSQMLAPFAIPARVTDADLLNAIGDILGPLDDLVFVLGKLPEKYEKLNGYADSYLSVSKSLNSRITREVGSALRTPTLTGGLDSFDALVAQHNAKYQELTDYLDTQIPPDDRGPFRKSIDEVFLAVNEGLTAVYEARRTVNFKEASRASVDHRKLLDHLIDEKEEKYIELVEGTRAYTATIDAYLKRLVVALEDDCRIQYYDPAFERIRGAAREYDVQLGQVERTTVLTNNRQLAKVEPTATMEFDLPKRDIVITEAMKGAKALVQDYGALLQDPTFLAATSLMSGSPPTTGFTSPMPPVPGLPNEGFASPLVKDVLPPLPTSPPQELMNLYGQPQPAIGSNLAALIPDPAIYKFETGTGFEIRPVIQPDGDSVIYDFNYMYTTNVREPVRADEKHLGRVKRHFLNTQVQTSTYELRELSRYTVALKAARTSRGVPLFEDIPGLGILFRPLPSAESSLQQNIILGQSTVYPTLFDLMGLRWAPYVVDLDDESLMEEEFVVRGRRKTVTDWTFDEGSSRVDRFLRVGEDNPQLLRPDLYRTPDRPSTSHPNGFDAPSWYIDPTNHNFRVPDGRPPEYRRPPFDESTGRLDRTPNPPVLVVPPSLEPGDPFPMLPEDDMPAYGAMPGAYLPPTPTPAGDGTSVIAGPSGFWGTAAPAMMIPPGRPAPPPATDPSLFVPAPGLNAPPDGFGRAAPHPSVRPMGSPEVVTDHRYDPALRRTTATSAPPSGPRTPTVGRSLEAPGPSAGSPRPTTHSGPGGRESPGRSPLMAADPGLRQNPSLSLMKGNRRQPSPRFPLFRGGWGRNRSATEASSPR